MNLIFKSPLGFGSLAKLDNTPVELLGPIYSESWPSPIVKVRFPNGEEMDVFTDELIIME